jgi:lipopolysaccharide/colanic/teichoic acid biosynthesis glycosyltransferase
MIILSVAVRLISPGPVFYRQARVGYRGKHFMILKFRSMKVNAATNSHESHVENLIQTNLPMTKMDASGDSRMIPGGWIMRATGLDELPQIFNVLRGEMSLVGPRPCIPSEFNCYKDDQKRRVEAPPGLTGLWQVNGKNRLTFTQMIDLDLKYRDTMSLWVDTWIIVRTVPAVLGQLSDAKKKIKAQAAKQEQEQKQATAAAKFGTGADFSPLGDVN